MCPVAQPKTQDLIKNLNKVKAEGKSLSAFEIKLLETEAEKVKQVDPAGAFTLLGIISSFKEDLEKLHSYHRRSVTWSKGTESYSSSLNNYFVSMSMHGLSEDILAFSKEVLEDNPDPIPYKIALDYAIRACDALGREEEFIDYAYKWEELYGEPHELMASEDSSEETLDNILTSFDEKIAQDKKLFVKFDPFKDSNLDTYLENL